MISNLDFSALSLRQFSNANDFISACTEFLYTDETFHNRLISSAELISVGSTVFREPQWFAAVYSREQVIGCAIHAEPDGLILSRMPSSIVELVLKGFSQRGILLSRLVCDSTIANQVALVIKKIGLVDLRLDAEWDILFADGVDSHDLSADGVLRSAQPHDLDEVRHWGRQYSEEVPAVVKIDEFFTRKLRGNELYVWDDNGPKAVLSISSRTRNGICISAVYTAKPYRRKGYATAIVHSATDKFLTDGQKFVTLSVLRNTSAAKIYSAIGFRKIAARRCFVKLPVV